MGGRDPATGLDPWPKRRPRAIILEHAPEGSFVVDTMGGRLLRLPFGMADIEDAELGRKFRYLVVRAGGRES